LEKTINIPCENIELDGLFHHVSDKKAAVISHPHPLYGGNMENTVVEVITEELIKNGYSTLRFNFRQVNTQGSDNDSIKDLKAAMLFLEDKGFKNNILLAGYSYGSWVNSTAISQGLIVSDSIMVSPPIAFMDYKNIKTPPGKGLVVTGTNDEIAPPELVQEKVKEWHAALKFETIKGCDHFYGGYFQELKKIISDYLK